MVGKRSCKTISIGPYLFAAPSTLKNAPVNGDEGAAELVYGALPGIPRLEKSVTWSRAMYRMDSTWSLFPFMYSFESMFAAVKYVLTKCLVT